MSNVIIDNVKETKRALSKYAPDVKKALDKANREAGKPLISLAKAQIVSRPMRNWGKWTSSKDGRDLSFDQGTATKGIKIKQRGRAKASPWSGVLQLRNESAVGAIYELAGRKTSGTGRGIQFVQNMQNIQQVQRGGLSRVIWRAIALFPAKKYQEMVQQNYAEAEKELQKVMDNMRSSV